MNTKQIKRFFKLAKNASEFSDYTKKNIHIGSVMVYKNRVISVGYNTDKTNPIQYMYNTYRQKVDDPNRNYIADKHLPCVHAEMKCLIDTRDLDVDWNKASLFVYRESPNGKLRNCKPCKACMKALKDRGIKHIYYTNEDGCCYKEI